MPIIQATQNLKLEKPEANHAAWERSYWRFATQLDLWLAQIARGHFVVSGGNLSLDGTDVDLDATTVQFAGTDVPYAVGPATPISPLVSGNTYVVYVDNAGDVQVSTLTPALLWAGALPTDFVLLGVVFELEGVWTIHNLPLTTARGKLSGVAGLNGAGAVVQEPASKNQPNGIPSLDANGMLKSSQGAVPIGGWIGITGTFDAASNGGSYSDAEVPAPGGCWKIGDGSQIVDAASPFNGRYVPDISDGRFLRGNASGGGLGGQAELNPSTAFAAAGNYTPGGTTVSHNHGSPTGNTSATKNVIQTVAGGTNTDVASNNHNHSIGSQAPGFTGDSVSRSAFFLNSAVNLEPLYLDAVFYQRIK